MESMILNNFAGEYISIHLNKDTKSMVQFGGDIRLAQESTQIEGWLVDEDDDYLYVGHTFDHISAAINKKHIVLMEIADPNADKADALNDAVDQSSGIN